MSSFPCTSLNRKPTEMRGLTAGGLVGRRNRPENSGTGVTALPVTATACGDSGGRRFPAHSKRLRKEVPAGPDSPETQRSSARESSALNGSGITGTNYWVGLVM